ncbi:glycosyltransferase family 39 protein [Aphanothece microscopica]|uniref:glycosyltransferase family 39 protein n=1 Tax=Aphanothece microscopica TaxID=1049561 RepID=UPI003CE58B8E
MLLNAISQGLVSGTADRDQAEQLLLSQSWQLGYGPQPPLYTYLVKLVFLVTGPALWPLLGLKVGLLSLLVAALLGVGRELAFSARQQLIAVSGLALIPQLIWESQRDLTHSVLATSVAALTLLQLLRLQRQPTATGYAGLGLLAAAGLLSKYSYGLFLASLVLAALSLPSFRRVLLRPRLILSLAIPAALVLPHLQWVVDHAPLSLGGLEKLELEGGLASRPRGLLSAAAAALAFLSPFWLAAVAVLWRSSSAGEEQPSAAIGGGRSQRARLLLRLPLCLAAVLLAFVLATGASRIKDRWYQPLLFYAPVSVAVLAGALDRRRQRALVAAAVVAATATSLLLPGRTVLAGLTGRNDSRTAPLLPLLAQVQREQGRPDWIVASGTFLGGNARQVFEATPVLTPKVTIAAGDGRHTGQDARVLVLVDPNHRAEELTTLLQTRFGRTLRAGELQPVSAPPLWGWGTPEAYTIRYAWIGAKQPE